VIAGWLILGVVMVASSRAAERPRTIAEFFADGAPTRVIAHRGFSARAPENTMVAIEMATEAGADMVEIDVTTTADGEMVVIHDETLERTTNGHGPVAAHTLAELQALDAGSWKSPQFAGEPIPTLEQVLDMTRGRILVNIEIKPEAVAAAAPVMVARIVLERRMEEEVLISSFEPIALAELRAEAPVIPTASLYNRELHRGLDPGDIVREVGAIAFNLDHRRLTDQMLRSCRELGLPVAVYTVNDRTRMQEMVAKGGNAIFTDRPDLLIEVLAVR
jgi:glycerophosphoryl diester phosphodiesterase